MVGEDFFIGSEAVEALERILRVAEIVATAAGHPGVPVAIKTAQATVKAAKKWKVIPQPPKRSHWLC